VQLPQAQCSAGPGSRCTDQPPRVRAPAAVVMCRSDAQLGANLDAVRNAGATWIRLDVDWSQIEPNPGSSDFSGPDRVVDAARSRGLQVLAITTYTPRWAQDVSVATGTSHGRPSSPGAAGP